MTLNEMISVIRSLNRGKYEDEQIIRWINEVDERIWREVILTHCDAPLDEFEPYTEADLTRELLAPTYYSGIYKNYVDSQIYSANADTVKANNSASAFNSIYNDYANEYNRTHMPRNTNITFRGDRRWC